jgi:hypothetical protein
VGVCKIGVGQPVLCEEKITLNGYPGTEFEAQASVSGLNLFSGKVLARSPGENAQKFSHL